MAALRSRVTITLDPELVGWVNAEAERRVCSPGVVIAGALRLLRAGLDTDPALAEAVAELPARPRPRTEES